ncbi:MAG: hypothetical protein QNK15_00830 [Cycloclasticus sp.]|nr:hypothetical protein [Cycloclasticus sp.]
MLINRRQFVMAAGAVAAGTLLGMDKVANIINVDDNDVLKNVTRSIHANFGSGFNVMAHYHHKDKTIVEIEHLENQFIVESADLSEWNILSSTVI